MFKVSVLALFVLLTGLGAVLAADLKGMISAVSEATRTITVDGVAIVVPPGISMNTFALGQNVSVTYTTANGVNTMAPVTKAAK